MYCVWSEIKESELCKMEIYSLRRHMVEESGPVYLDFELKSGDMNNVEYKDFSNKATFHCLMIPNIQENQEFDGKHAIIFDDWDVIDKFGRKGLPELNEMLFGRAHKGGLV